SRANPPEQEMLKTLVNQSHQLVRLVENLLDMAKLESGSTVLNRQWHVLEELIGSALARVRQDLSSHKVIVQIPESFPLILVDGFLLEQAFLNLLENASRYTSAGTDIEISAKSSGNRVELHFADNGPGLPPGTEKKVFDKFFRATAATPDGRRGVGLGLAICQGIVQAHGGQIIAANRPTGGAEFVISLPCKQQSPQAAVG
ncbi:MAG TPA: ATP-binding protein, partial [Pirellulales bacterium]